MYIRKAHQFREREALPALIARHPLGAWVFQGADGALIANHIPFVFAPERGPQGSLLGHVSRANGVWRELAGGRSSLVMFRGPQAYVTPAWYPGKTAHGEVVPTWNYAVVHAHGPARCIDEPAGLLEVLERLTAAQEAAQTRPWQVNEAPRPYIERMLHAIVGIEIRIERLEGKLKASQDEAAEDRLGTARGLTQQPDSEAQQMGLLVHEAARAEGLG